MKNVLKQLNWFAVSSTLFILAMFAVLLTSGTPDFYAVPLGLTAVTAAVLSLRTR